MLRVGTMRPLSRHSEKLSQYDQPMEEEAAIIPSPSPVVPAPTLAVGTDNETSVPKTSPPPKRQTRSESRFASFVITSILEPPMEDDSELEGSLTGPIAAKDRAASSLVKGPASKGPPKTADRRRGQPSMAVCGHTSVHVIWELAPKIYPEIS